MKSCETCSHCVLADHGYSNWTVEGTSVHCSKKIHPDSGFDRWYGEDHRLHFADTCHGYEEGKAIELDVDQENSMTQEQIIKIRLCGIRYWRDEHPHDLA